MPMAEVAAAMNDFGFRQIFGSRDAFRSIRQILSWARHSNALLGQLVWPRNLQCLLASVMPKLPLLMLKSLRSCQAISDRKPLDTVRPRRWKPGLVNTCSTLGRSARVPSPRSHANCSGRARGSELPVASNVTFWPSWTLAGPVARREGENQQLLSWDAGSGA